MQRASGDGWYSICTGWARWAEESGFAYRLPTGRVTDEKVLGSHARLASRPPAATCRIARATARPLQAVGVEQEGHGRQYLLPRPFSGPSARRKKFRHVVEFGVEGQAEA